MRIVGDRRKLLALAGMACCAAQAPAFAQEAAPAPADPVDLSAQWSQFASTVVAGEAEGETRYGGRVDAYAKIDGASAGIADGLTINVQAEFIYGKSINRVGARTLLPVNTALAFPSIDDEDFDLSINLVQRIGKVRLQAGKINLLDASSSVPILAGGGKEGFQNVALASPPGLIASPKVLGAIASVPAGRLILNFGVWTPESWIRKYDPFQAFDTGVSGMAVAVLPAKIGGLQEYHTLSLFMTSRRPSREGLPDIRPPEGSDPLLSSKHGGTHLRYAVQQFLWQDPTDPKRGGGFFGHFGVSLGSPGLLDWSIAAGLAGNVPFKGHPRDKMGIGYFRFSLANRIVDGLAATIPLADEQGGEIYYTAQVGKQVRVTASAQLIDPILARAPNSANLNLRAVADF